MANSRRRCIIFCAYDVTREDIALAHITEDDYIIAADAGYHRAAELGFVPQLILGDFDSSPQPQGGTIPILTYPPEKDDTDCMIAVKAAFERGMKDIAILGSIGGRLDHTVANIQTLAYIVEHGGTGWLYGGGNIVTLIENSGLEFARWGKYLSVFAMDGPCTGVTQTGLKFCLKDADVTPCFPLGVSNEFVEDIACVSVKQGKLLIILTNVERHM